MKLHVLAILVFAPICIAHAQPAVGVPDLRQALRQYHPSGAPPAVRQLSAAERVELRRQLAEGRKPAARKP